MRCVPKEQFYEPGVDAGVAEAAGVLGLLSVDAGLLSFAVLPESVLESDLEVDPEFESLPDELLSDELLFAA